MTTQHFSRMIVLPALAWSLCAYASAQAAEHDDHMRTPIRHVVVIFQENVSFDHYFGTYPNALNLPGDPPFHARRKTPGVTTLASDNLLAPNNPNSAQPFRFERAQAATCDQNHEYRAEQEAVDGGKMDKFVETVGNGPATDGKLTCKASDTMGYFDGNTVTALWNYAQSFAMSDNHFGTTYGPSTPGALNLIAGQTHGADTNFLSTPFGVDVIEGSVIGDPQPRFDDCSTRETVAMIGQNVGDLLNANAVSWGFFQGGFKPTAINATTGKAVCGSNHIGSNGKPKGDYIPHHQPFQYYSQTANPKHLPPTSVAMIGRQGDQANHQYDVSDFWDAVEAGNLPAVSYLKAPGFQDGHASYSDPLAEQTFLVQALNRLQQTPQWEHMAIIIAYDDSDGWYDHVLPPTVRPSHTAEDALGVC